MVKLADIPNKAKAWAGAVTSVAAVAAICAASYGHFMTDAEAADQHQKIVAEQESYRAQIYRADKNDRIDRHTREVNRIEYQLLSEDLTDMQRQYLQGKRTELISLIDCIRQDHC